MKRTKQSKKRGLPPGSLVYIGDGALAKAQISMLSFSAGELVEKELVSPEEAMEYAQDPKTVTWIDIRGLVQTDVIAEVGKIFDLHSLHIEDVLNTDHRPKVEELNDIIFLILKYLHLNTRGIEFEQVSLFMGEHFVLSFQDAPEDVFKAIKNRIRNNKNRIRSGGPDYLFYALVDYVVDSYLQVLESLGDRVDSLEGKITDSQGQSVLLEMRDLRHSLLKIKRYAVAMRDSIKAFSQTEFPEITPQTRVYFGDVYEHSVQTVEMVRDFRESLMAASELYVNLTSQRTNEIMKVLTIIATIFIPLTFIAGVYGMNFDYMPELSWQWGYFAVWGFMIGVALFMLIFFRRKNWI